MKPIPPRALRFWNDGRFAPHIAAMGGSSPAGNTTTTNTSEPWAGQQGPLLSVYGQAQNLDQNAVPQYYPNSTYAPLSGQQQGLMSNLIGYTGSGGGPALSAASGNAASTLSPDFTAQTQDTFNKGTGVLNNELQSSYLDPNNSPYYRTAISNAMASAIPAVSASFVNGNRSDSGLAQAAETSAATNAAAGLAQNQYNQNQNIQQTAAAQAGANLANQQGIQSKDLLAAPVIDQSITSNLGAALNTSGMSQQDIQNQINADISRYNYAQMLPWNQLGLYEGAITGTGSPGQTSTSTQPYFSNTGANVAAGVSTVATLAAAAATIY